MCAVPAEKNIAVQVVGVRVRGPFEPDNGREASRLVGFFRRIDLGLPSCLVGWIRRSIDHFLGESPFAEGHDHLDGGVTALARLHHVIPSPPLRHGEQFLLSGHEIGDEPHVVGVVRHHEPVEWPGQFHPLAARGRDLLAASESIRVARAEAATKNARIEGQSGVQVRVAEERSRREVAACIGRIARLGWMHFFERRLVLHPGVLRPG